MSLRDKWTDARERDRQGREASEAHSRRYRKAEELGRLGVSVVKATGLDPELTEEVLDAMLAAEKKRQAALYKEFVRVGTVTTFRALGVQILTGVAVVKRVIHPIVLTLG